MVLGNIPNAETYRRGRGTGVVRAHRHAVLDGTVLVYIVWDPPLSFRGTLSDRSEGTLTEPGDNTSSISVLETWQ